MVDLAVGGEVCGAASHLGIARVATNFMDIHHWHSTGLKQVLQYFSPADRLYYVKQVGSQLTLSKRQGYLW